MWRSYAGTYYLSRALLEDYLFFVQQNLCDLYKRFNYKSNNNGNSYKTHTLYKLRIM